MDPHQLFRAIVALNALFASMAWCLARPNRASMAAVLVFAVLWPLVDKPLGGRTLYTVSEGRGITEGDLLSVFAFGIVAVQVARLIIRTHARRSPATLVEQEPIGN